MDRNALVKDASDITLGTGHPQGGNPMPEPTGGPRSKQFLLFAIFSFIVKAAEHMVVSPNGFGELTGRSPPE